MAPHTLFAWQGLSSFRRRNPHAASRRRLRGPELQAAPSLLAAIVRSAKPLVDEKDVTALMNLGPDSPSVEGIAFVKRSSVPVFRLTR
jgi:hypothetical protein